MKQATQQLGRVAKGAVEQILKEPFEVAKTAGKQVVGTEVVGAQQPQQPTSVGTGQDISQPSLEEQKKATILAAHGRELEEQIARQRAQRLQKIEGERVVEAKKSEEQKEKKKIESESIFQKGLRLVTGRLKRRIETRLPKAA